MDPIKEAIEALELPEPAHKAEGDGMTWPEAFDADQMREYAQSAVRAALAAQQAGVQVPQDESLKRLHHCAIAVRDWLGEGCDTNDIPRPHIAALVAFCTEVAAAPEAPAQADNWQQYAKEGETAQDVIERERKDNDALVSLLAKARSGGAALWALNEVRQYAVCNRCDGDTDFADGVAAANRNVIAFIDRLIADQPTQAEAPAQADPTDPGHDVDVLREHVRHLERHIRQLHAAQPTQGEAPSERDYGGLTERQVDEIWQRTGRLGDMRSFAKALIRAALASQPQAVDAENAARYLYLKKAWTTTLIDGSVQMANAYGIRCRSVSEIDAAIDAARRAGGAA